MREDEHNVDLWLRCRLPAQGLPLHTWRRLNWEDVASATDWFQAVATIN